MNADEREAKRRIDEAGHLIRSAIRLGGDPEYVASTVRMNVSWGAEQYAEDVCADYEKACQ